MKQPKQGKRGGKSKGLDQASGELSGSAANRPRSERPTSNEVAPAHAATPAPLGKPPSLKPAKDAGESGESAAGSAQGNNTSRARDPKKSPEQGGSVTAPRARTKSAPPAADVEQRGSGRPSANEAAAAERPASPLAASSGGKAASSGANGSTVNGSPTDAGGSGRPAADKAARSRSGAATDDTARAEGKGRAPAAEGESAARAVPATMAPPGRRPRVRSTYEGGDEGGGDGSDEQIWSDQAPSTQPLASASRKLAAELAAANAALGGGEEAESRAAFRLTRGSTGDRLREAAGFGSGDRLREAAAFGSAQSLLSTDYYFRQYGAHGMRSLSAEVDDFGFDPHVDERARPLLETLCKRYFRVEVVGAENIPEGGRALLVANRSGALPWDGLVLRTALRARRPELSPLRWLSEDSVIHYPFMGVLMNRLGAVRACPENAERLLAQNRLVAVFPEGAQGSRKLYRDRYRLQRFGRGGYVKLALKFETPILPVAIIGGEETNPVLGRSRLLGRLVGSDSLPITPTFPWLGVAGLLPAPVKWRIVIGEPIDLSAHGAAAADDALVVHRLNEQIRSSLQALVDQGKRTRGRALFG